METLVEKVEKIRSRIAVKKAIEHYPAKVLKGTDPGGFQVNFSNTLTNAAHMLTLAEKRILMFAISKVDSTREYENGIIPPIAITAAEYAKAFGINDSSAYTEMKLGSLHLIKRVIVYEKEDGQVDNMNWVGRASYKDKRGWVEIAFHYELTPHLSQLSKRFTSYKLRQASALKSVYAWRLLELLSQWKDTGLRIDTLEDFAFAMGAKPSYTKNFAQLRRWVIEPAVKELVEKDGWEINWTPKKAGKKVVGLTFKFKRNVPDPSASELSDIPFDQFSEA